MRKLNHDPQRGKPSFFCGVYSKLQLVAFVAALTEIALP